jgi:hypothetical protein
MRPRGAVTIGGDAAGRVVVVVEIVGTAVVVDGVVAVRGGADEPHAAVANSSAVPTLHRPSRRRTPS